MPLRKSRLCIAALCASAAISTAALAQGEARVARDDGPEGAHRVFTPPESVGRPICSVEIDLNAVATPPFCSERCKLIDLGAWASESYRVPVETPPEPEAPAPRDN